MSRRRRPSHGARGGDDARGRDANARRDATSRAKRRARTSCARYLSAFVAFVASAATRASGAPTSDVCYGAAWEPTTSATKMYVSKTVRPLTRVPSEHPLYEDAYAKACLNTSWNTSAPTEMTLPRTTNANNELYWSSALGACATTPTVSAGQLFYNRANMGSTASHAESNTGLEKDKTVRIVFVSDDSAGAHVVVLAGASSTASTSDPEVGLLMEGNALRGLTSVFIEEPRGFTNAGTSGSACEPSTSSSNDCFELDANLGLGKFRWGSGTTQRGIVVGHVPDVNEHFTMKFQLLNRIDAVELGTFDETTRTVSWVKIPKEMAMRGFRIESMLCDDHCLAHDSCASCAADDACGYCPWTQTCKQAGASCADELDPTSTEGLDVLGECLDTCGSALTCGACTERDGCGWCHTTGRCTAARLDGSAPQDGNCSAFNVDSCATCPGAVTSTLMPAYLDTDAVHAFCNARGTCDNVTRTCACDDGYGGEGCAKMCPGGASNPCSRRGVCDADTGECFCDPGYGGSRCESVGTVGACACGVAHTHVNADGTRQSTCSGRLDSNGACVCLEGWAGANCADACPGAGVVGAEVCGGHGSCNPATGTCDCDPCYSRDLSGTCVQDACATCDAERGVCSCVGGSMTCACRGQFDGYACDQCKCGANGRCNALSGECECDAGYGGELCDRALVPTPTCQNGGTWNAALSRCVGCNSGKSGVLCDVDCDPDVKCGGHGTCNTDGSCACFTGYDASSNCGACVSGYGPYPECGKTLAAAECSDASGGGYDGTTNSTISGKQCQSWSSQTPTAHPYDASSSGSTTNECRNPSGTAAHPWCYVDTNALTGPGTYERNQPLWEFCSVPVCKPSSYTSPPKVCGVFGAESVTPFALNATGRRNAVSQVALTTTSGSLDKSGCAGAIDLANPDVVLHGNFVARFKEDAGAGYARRVIEYVGVKASTATPAHDSVEVKSDGTVKIDGVAYTSDDLPYSDGGTGVLCVSDWTPVSSGLSDASTLTITISETTVANVTRIKACSSCADQLIVVLSVPYSTTATGICAHTGNGAVDFAGNAEASAPWGAGGALASTGCAASSSHDPGTPTASEKKWCEQCSYLGEMHAACVAQMTNEGFSFTRAGVVEACRSAFIATYGYDRTIPSHLTETVSTPATLEDTVYPYRGYAPTTEQFLLDASADRLSFDVKDVTETLPKHIVGETRVDASRTRLTGLPRTIDGETDTTQTFPFPRIQDSCRAASDVGATSGYRVYAMRYDSAENELVEITMCGSATGTVVGVYEKDYAKATTVTHDSGVSGDGTLNFTFTPWVNGLATYEARFEYELAPATGNVTFSVVRTSASENPVIGTFEFYPPTSSSRVGFIGFEFNVPSDESSSAVTFAMTPDVVADSRAMTVTSVTVYAKNYAQAALKFPPFGGFKQKTCATFQATTCGSMPFTAVAKTTYYIVVSGLRDVSGAFRMHVKKVRADVTSVSTSSDNAAPSSVRAVTGVAGVADGTPTPYKLATYGDALRVVVRTSHAVDKPIIRLGNYEVPSGSILGAAGGTEYSATAVVSSAMAAHGAHITVDVSQASSLSLPSRGFDRVTHPLGADIALVVVDATPLTVSHAWIVNPVYALGIGAGKAPTTCTDVDSSLSARNVNITAAKYARAGEYIAVIFTPSEPAGSVTGTIGGATATRWIRATAPLVVTLAVDRYVVANSATHVECAYALIDDASLTDGVLPFEISFADAVGNVGAPITSAVNALTGTTMNSPLNDRLSAARLMYDKSAPRPTSATLSYASSAEITGNQGLKPSYYHGFTAVDAAAKEYRLGDTVVVTGAWTEHVTRPYGAYFRSSASSGAHVPQANITVSPVGRALPGKMECFASEFRPRAQESISVAQGFGGSNYVLSRFFRSWKISVTTVDPCDVVGKGALAWASRADCQAETAGGNALWIPAWSAWCRRGWGTLGYAFLGGVDPAGNVAVDLRRTSQSPNNADATVSINADAAAGDVVVRAPIPLAGKTPPSWLNSVPRGDWTADPKVIEVYIEPRNVRWNEYRRVVKVGDMLQIQMYTDQPVKAARVIMGNNQALPAATHAEGPSAYNVELPCGSQPDMAALLGSYGLLALEEELYNDGSTFADDEDWFDWLMQTSYNHRQPVPNVPNYPNAAVTCSGFWVQRGARPNGKSFSVRRLCPNRYYLRRSVHAAAAPVTCTDVNDRLYKATGAYNYWVVNFRYLASHQTGLPDGPLQIQWQLTTRDNRVLPSSSTWTTSQQFFTDAGTSADVAHLKPSATDAVGPAFDPALSCGRNAAVAFDQAGSAIWAVKDTVAPGCASGASCDSTTVASVANGTGVPYPAVTNPTTSVVTRVATAGDIVTLVVSFDEHIAAGVYVTVNDLVTARATKVDKYAATFTFTVTQALANVNDFMSFKVFNLKDIQEANAATGDFQTSTFSGEKIRLQGASELSAFTFANGETCSVTSNNGVDTGWAKDDDVVTVSLTLPNPPSGNGAAAVHESKIAGATATPTVSCSGQACTVSMTRTVDDASSDFVDGNPVSWSLVLVGMTRCAHNSGATCATRMKLVSCGPNINVDSSVVVDYTPPTILSSVLTEPNDATRPVVKDGGDVKIDVTVSETMASLTYELETRGAPKCAVDITGGAQTITSGTDTLSSISVTYDADTAHCVLEIICVTFSGTDRAGHPLTNPKTCRNFGPSLAADDPGWFTLHNVVPVVTMKSLIAPLGLNCMDSSVDTRACADGLSAATLEYGNFLRVELSSPSPVALTDFSLDGNKLSEGKGFASTPYVVDNAWSMSCADAVEDDLCVRYATSATCRAYFCPTCAYSGMCDFSCGYCDSRRGFSTTHVVTLSTTDFALSSDYSNQPLLVTWAANPGVDSSGGTVNSNTALSKTTTYSAPNAATSCAGRCGGAASGCECDPTCKLRGTCCADAGHCCLPGTPTAGATNLAGGCLRAAATTLSVTKESWGVDARGARTSYVNRFSTVYIKLTASKPIDVRRVLIGGVLVPESDVSVEYASETRARRTVAEALAAYGARNDASFAAKSADVATEFASLPKATYSWNGDPYSVAFPDIPNTPTATIRVSGQSLSPQPAGPLAYEVVYHERSGAYYFTDNPELTISGVGPHWLNPPRVQSVSLQLLAASTTCDETSSTPAVVPAESSGLTKILSGHQLRTVITFTDRVIVDEWRVEGASMYCDGGCHRRGLCRANPREEPPNARDDAEYVTRWTSCRTFDAKEIPNAFAEYACGIREYVQAYDRAGNVAVSDGFHDETLCFSLPVAAPSQGLITVRGLTSCRRSSTTKRYGPGCVATITVEADGPIMRPTVKYWDGSAAVAFPSAECALAPSPAGSASAVAWTMTCSGDAVASLPEGTLQLEVSGVRDTAGTTFASTAPSTDDGYKGADVVPIVVDKTPPHPKAAVPASCSLTLGSTTTLTVTFNESSWRPTITAFHAQVGGVVAQNGETSGFHTIWNAPVVVPSTWRGGNIMPFIITDGEDDVGNNDPTLYGNMPPANGATQLDQTESPTVNCTVTYDAPRVVKATCSTPTSRVVKPGNSVQVGFTTNVNVGTPPAGCVTIAGVDAAVSGGPSTWTATATIPADACDGEVPLRICELTSASTPTIVGTTTVNKFFGADAAACLIDGTSPVLQLVDFTSDNPYDDKIAKEGDVVRLYFEASEMVTRPTMTIDGNTPTAVAVDVSGPARRRFPTSLLPAAHADADAQYAIAWEVEYTVASSTPAGEMTWDATTFTDRAGNAGAKAACADWNAPSCALVHGAQTTAERVVEPRIDFTGEVVQTFDDFLTTTPSGNASTLFGCYVNSSSTTLSALNLATLKNDLTRHNAVAGGQFQHYLATAQDLWWRRGGACGAANGLMCRKTCGRCNDDAVVVHKTTTTLTAANVTAGGVAVAGDLCPGGVGVCMCDPALGDNSQARFLVSTTARIPVSKPTVRFTDANSTVYTVPAANVSPVNPQSWPALPSVPCLGDQGVRDGVCDADERLNNRDGCWDGGDCCVDTCRQTHGDDGAFCQTQRCRDHALSPITGRPTAGFWSSYNAKSAVARDLAVEWMVVFTLDDSVPLVDGKIVGSACCMQDSSGLDVIDSTQSNVFKPGAPCLDATLTRDARCLTRASLSADSGAYVVKENQPVTLELEFDGNPRGMNCTVGGESVTMTQTRAASAGVTALWSGARASIAASDAVIARRIADAEEQKRRHALVPSQFPLNLFPNCSRGVTIPFACSIVDCGGDAFDVDDSIDPTPDVCFDHLRPDATTISQSSNNTCSSTRAKVGDRLTLDVTFDADVTDPASPTLAGEACTLTRASANSNAFACYVDVSQSTVEGPAAFALAGMTSPHPAYLSTVNATYAELASMDADAGAVTLGGDRVVVDHTPPTYVSVDVYSLDVNNATCARRCTARVSIEANEELSSCDVTIGGVQAVVTGTGRDRVAEVELNETLPGGGDRPDGYVSFSAQCRDLACNLAATSSVVGASDELQYVSARLDPLEVLFYSDRPGRLEVASEVDCLMMEMTFILPVTLTAVVMGNVTRDSLSAWNVTTTGGANVQSDQTYEYFLVTHCVTTDLWGSSDWPEVPWSFTYDDGAGEKTWNAVTTRRFDYPRRVRLDLEPPTATYVYAYTTGALDPSAGIGDALFLDINASEPVVAPRVTFGDVELVGGNVTQRGSSTEWRAGPYVVKNATEDANKLTNVDDCFLFTLRLTDLVDHASETYSTQVAAAGSTGCPNRRVDIDQTSPTIVWLQTESIDATTVNFTFAVDEFSNVSFVALPRGSSEPTPLEVRAGTGNEGVGAAARGVKEYLGSSTPSPGSNAGGKGLDSLSIGGLVPGTQYDVWFVPFDVFGNYQAEAQSRWIRTVGLDMLTDPLAVLEGGYTDVVHVKLTQIPTANVDVVVAEQSGVGNVVLADQGVNPSAYAASVTLTFTPTDWNVAQEVGVKAVDDAYVEDAHSEVLQFTINSADVRYDSLVGPTRAVAIEDNDECGVVAYDPTNRPLERTLTCGSNQVVALLNYSIAEDSSPTKNPTYVDVYMKAAVRGDDVRVTLSSSDLTQLSLPAGNQLVFNETNYNLAQRVPIVPAYSCVAGPTPRFVPIDVVVSSSSSCGALVVPQIPVYIDDLQTVGLVYSKSHITGVPGDYEFDMYLTSQPTEDVHVSLDAALPPVVGSTATAASASFDCGGQGATWTFSKDDCSVPVTCVVTLIGDDASCGDVTLRTTARVVSNDASYHELASAPPNVTVSESANAAGWFVRDDDGADIVTPPNAPNGTAPLPPWRVREQFETGAYTLTPVTPPCKAVTIKPYIPDTEYDRFMTVTPREATIPAGFVGPTRFRVVFPRNYHVPPRNEVVQIWHDVVGVDDDVDYKALSPNLGGSAVPVEIVEYDVPGVLLGNGAENTVMIDEPCATTVQTQVSSLGFTLSSAPSANVVVTLGEMTYNASMVSTLGASEHLILGTTSLTFTPNDWNIPQPVMVSAIPYANLTEARTAYACAETSSADSVYAALNRTCYPIHICDCSGSCGLISFAEHANCTFASDQLNNTEISFPSSFTQLSSCWNVTASCGGIAVASLTAAGHQPVLTEFTTLPESGAYNDITKIQRLRHYDSQWSVVDRATWPLTATGQGVSGYTNAVGVYCLGYASSAFILNNTANGGLFKEKEPALNAFAQSFDIIQDAANTFDSDVYLLEVNVLAGASPATDGYDVNCTDGGNFTAPGGCIIGPSLRGYFNNATQVMTFTNLAYLPEASIPSSGRRRALLSRGEDEVEDDDEEDAEPRRRRGGRRLLQTPTPATTQQFIWAVNNITFRDISLDPTGATRMMNTRVVDQYGAIVEGPLLSIDTVGVNDAPVIDIDLPIVYTEKESLTINAPYQAYDVDSVNWTQCVVNITDINNNFMPGDSLGYNKTAIIERYKQLNTSLPFGFVDIDAAFADAQRTVTFTGAAPPAAYLRAMRNLILLNPGPAMTNDDRWITFCCYDPEVLNNRGCGVQRVLFQPVNDPPTADDVVFYLADPRLGGLTNQVVPGGDPDGDVVTYNVSCQPNKGTLTFDSSTGRFDYAPNANIIGNDRFVYFTWDGVVGPSPRPLQSKFATVEIRLGNGETTPVARDIYVEVWENAPEYVVFDATDADSTDAANTNDISRYQILREPELNVGGVVLDAPVTSGGKRYSENATFRYAAYTGSDIVARVQRNMNAYPTNFDFNTLAREQHPGFNVTSFQYVAVDLSGRVSNVATATVWVRLTTETNTRPSAQTLSFTTLESVVVASDFDTTDVESPAQLRHSLPTGAGTTAPTLGVASQVGVAANPYSKAFRYDPHPYYYGTDSFQYLVTDPHGSTSDLTTVTVTITNVNQPPQGACGANSTLKASPDPIVDLKGRAAELTFLEGYQILRARVISYANNTQLRDAEFYHYDAFIDDLAKFEGVVDKEQVFFSCGSTATLTSPSQYHDAVTAVALLAYDVDQPLRNTIRYVLSQEPTLAASSDPARGAVGYAGALYPYVAPNGTFYNATNTTTYSYASESVSGATPLAAGDVIGDASDGPALLLFKPRAFVRGPVTFKWHAVDTSVSPPVRGDDVTMTIASKCRGGERVNGVHGETCDLCPAGWFNSAGIPDQQTCVRCPSGSYTSAEGQTKCVPCPADTYSDVAGAAQCPPCPANKRSPSGSDDASDCLCDIGFVVLNSTACHRCALDRVKCTDFGQYMPLPYDGFWQDPRNGAVNLTCVPGTACVEKYDDDAVRAETCAPPRFYDNATNAPAYEGRACSRCAADHYRYASFCDKCDALPGVRIFFIILLYSVALYVIFELATHPAIPALTILLTFGQITSQMQYFEIPWPKALARWMQVASLTFADLQILGLDCVARWDYFTRFAATMFAPFLWALLTGVAVVFRCWREIAHQAYLGVQRRRLIERRRKLMQYDVDGKKWSDLATERDGLPFDRVDLKGKGDDYTAMEKHLYGTSSNEGLRRRGFAEIVASQGGLDMKLKTSMERKKLARKMIKTREELDELQAKRIANNKIIRSNINRAIPSLIIVMWWGYSLLSRTVIEFFECKNNQEAVVLVADPQIQCNVGKHLEWKPVAFAGFALYPIGLFVAAAAWLYAHRSTSKTRPRVHVLASKASKTDREKAILVEHFEERYGMMYNSLRPHFYLWMCVDLGKKLTIIGVKAFFPNDTLMQSFVAMVLFVTFGVFSTRHPYVNANLNVAEMLATFMNAITLITGFYFQLGIMEAVSRDIATGVMLIGLASTTVVLVAIVVVEFFPWMKRLIFLLKYHTTNDVLKPDKIGTHESGPQGWSCYIWPSHSPFRYACWRAVHHPLFDRVVSCFVWFSLACLATEQVLYRDDFVSDAYTRIVWFNTAISVLFVGEAFVKICALGFILGDGAYLRDSFNCVDFFVVVVQFFLFIVNVTTNVLGARSTRLLKFIRLARFRYFRIASRFFRFNSLRSETFNLLVLEAKAEDSPELTESIARARVIFEPSTAETVEYHLRVLQPDILRVATGLIDELYDEQFDPNLTNVIDAQTDAVRQTVQNEYQSVVYEWLALVAEPNQKRNFMNTLKNIRDVALELGPKGVADEMLRQRFAVGEIMNSQLYQVPADFKTNTREYKRRVAKDSKSYTSTKMNINRQFNAFQASMSSDDKVEDALNALPLHAVEEDSALARRLAEQAAVRIRNRDFSKSMAKRLVHGDLDQRTPADLVKAAQDIADEPETSDVGGASEPKPAPVKSSGLFAKFRRRGEVEKTKDAT